MASNTVIKTNVLALNAQRNLGKVGGSLSKASSRLSSGKRINGAADDAAGLAISQKMKSQIRGLDQASRNAQDTQALATTAEGGMDQMSEMVQRMRELAVQSASDTNTDEDRILIQDETNQLLSEIDEMSSRVEYNGMKLLDGSFSSKKFQIGANTSQTMTFDINSMKVDDLGLTDLKSTGIDTIGSVEGLKNAVTTIKDAGTAFGTMKTASNTAADAYTELNDALNAYNEIANYVKNNKDGDAAVLAAATALLGTASTDLAAILSAYNAATGQTGAMNFDGDGVATLSGAVSSSAALANNGVAATVTSSATAVDTAYTNYAGKTLLTQNGSANAISTLDSALSKISKERSKLGAIQNRLDYTNNSLQISSENLSAAESRISDADMAKEMMSYTSANVLQQAATSMLAQANQAPNNVLSLLG